MATEAPAQLSGLANLLLRRPPSLRELVTLVGYADDYAWFVGLVRRLFPQEAEAALAAPDVRGRVERFANLFGERHFPLYAPFIEFWTEEEGEQPPWSWLRQGIPFDLMGFGYDGLHEMWDGYREGLSAMTLLVKPADAYYDGPRRDTGGLAGVGRRTHPARDIGEDPPGRHTPGRPHRRAEGDPFRGGGASLLLGHGRDRQLLPRPHLRGRQSYDGFSDPWDDDIIQEGTEEWRKASALMDSVGKLTDWLEEDIPGRFAEMLAFVLGRLPNQDQEDNEHD